MMHHRSHYIYPDLDTLAAAFVCDVNRFMHEHSSQGREINVALSGGTTPLSVFRQLVHSAELKEWEHVHFYWGDERCVPPGSSESNYGNASRLFLDPLGFPGERIHPIRAWEDPDKEADRYGRMLLEKLPVSNGFPVFDWVWLGLGTDGHIASIFPDQIHLMKSDRTCAVAVHPESGQKRITLTGGVINNARRIAFLVTGRSKSAVVNDIVMNEGKYLDYPAFYVSPVNGETEWYLDMEATSWM
jgi:6-phosphogluconolactonase